MEDTGILRKVKLPQTDWSNLWEKIVLPKSIKDSLLGQVALEFNMRGKFSRAAVPLHGVILLAGPPGTGKTTICRGLASVAAEFLNKEISFVEVEPHTLTASKLGQSQRQVQKLFQDKLPEYAAQGPTIVLLDEVETLAVDRNRLSLEANPIDVHRATDAVLASLDFLAEEHPQLLFLATSNFEGAIDPAFLSRADLIVRVERPTREACESILRDTLETLGAEYPQMLSFLSAATWPEIVDASVGLDGRQLRKAVLAACALEKEVAVNPNKLTSNHLQSAFGQMKAGARGHQAQTEVIR